jgi:hypothetical protein
MTRAEFEHDEAVKKQMLHDMLRDRSEDIITEEDAAKQEVMAQTQLRQRGVYLLKSGYRQVA